MSRANTIADFIMQSWAKIAMTPIQESSVIETKMDKAWQDIASRNPTEFAKQGIAMAVKDVGADINPYGTMDDNELDKLIKEEIAQYQFTGNHDRTGIDQEVEKDMGVA